MRAGARRLPLLALLLASGAGGVLAVRAVVAAGPADATPPMTSTLDDQIDLALTVYNSNIALVRDVRQLAFDATGPIDLHFGDIAATVNPATVHFRTLDSPGAVRVLEQNYQYDLLEPAKLLDKYVGRDVTLVRRRAENGTTHEEVVTARLVSNNGGPVWRIGDEIVTGLAADHLRFPELPANLFVRPTLVWTLDRRTPGAHRVEASYLAGGLAWSADYVLTVGRDEGTADLDGWVTLTNNSGTRFEQARLQLVAGDLNRVSPKPSASPQAMMAEARLAAEAADMRQEAFAEYHLYTLGRRTTIANKETKQVALLNGAGVPVRKHYVVTGQRFYYHNRHAPGSPIKDPVQVFYRLRNDQASNLGQPLPAGVVRVYQADSRGSLQFVGEDRIEHTPKDEEVAVKIGHAFDVVAERRQTGFERIAPDIFEVEHEVVLRNHKETAIEVQVDEPIGGTWQMLRSSHAWEKTSAWAARFTVPVPAGGSATLGYRVRVEY
ncbi:MAG: DUF4139 domain-containing protein [Vicinamibacteraceae bacterium]|nr:DUF4139 domain-containing protein [Vicinamibacteraceae bacterium]